MTDSSGSDGASDAAGTIAMTTPNGPLPDAGQAAIRLPAS
jgi:hypothetical protein